MELSYSNAGKTPALDVRARYHVRRLASSTFTDETFNGIIEADIAAERCSGAPPAPGADVIYPGQPDGYKMRLNFGTGFVTDTVINGTEMIVFEMCFTYRTVEEIHRSSLCYYWRTGEAEGLQWNICTAGNHTN